MDCQGLNTCLGHLQLVQIPLGLLWDGTGLIFLPGAGLGLCWEQSRRARDAVATPGQGWHRGEVGSAPGMRSWKGTAEPRGPQGCSIPGVW